MFSKLKTADITIQPLGMRDPLELLNAHIHDLLWATLEKHFERSRDQLPSMYLAKLQFVSGDASGNRLSMRFDLHVKEDNHATDAAIISLTLNAKPGKG